MEEKRKKTGDDDGVSKHPNTRSGRKEEQAQPTIRKEVGEASMKPGGSGQPARMEVDESAKKVKE